MKGFLRSKDDNTVHQLKNAMTTIGREGSDVTLPFSSIEKQHAIVEFDESEGCFILQDLNSANGTYVNEHRVQNSAVRLAPGDIIRFGFGNPGYEFAVEQASPIHYSSLPSGRPWINHTIPPPSSQYNSTSLPYISSALSSLVDSMPVFQGSRAVNLPNTGLTSEMRTGVDSWAGGVMPHPPLRARPATAGVTKPRPLSAGREHPPMMSRGGWLENAGTSLSQTGHQTVEELEERLLRMGDELSRLASYEAECHRKDGVINSLRDEVADLKTKLGSSKYGFRGGGEDSAFSSIGIVGELRQQSSHLQALLKEKEEAHRTVTQKLTSYQEQLHIKNEELNTLKQQLDSRSSPTIKVKQDPNATTNTLASLKTQLAEKDRKIAQLTHDLDKANKQKTQTSTLLNSLQRDNSAKDSLVQQVKMEAEKLKKQLREKDVTISTISAKLTRQKATKEAEIEADKRERELTSQKERFQITEKQLKERSRQVSELQDELERVKKTVYENRQSDRSLQQELDHAKAQFLDANRAEKLLKVDMQQLEKRFDRFRRKAIQNIFIGGKKTPGNRELDDDELLDHIKDQSQENAKLVEEIKEYAEAGERAQSQKADFKEAMTALRKDMENMERHLSKYGRRCKTIEEEVTKLEELHTHDSLLWIKDVMSRLLTNEMSWQKRAEETMRRAGVEYDDSSEDDGPTIEDLCRELKAQREKCRQLQGKISEMEETHQDVLLKLREDAKHDEERKIARAVAEVKAEEQEKRHEMAQEMREKEHERIREAVETERRILESQHGSVTQMQQALSDKEHELNRYRTALGEAKSQYEQAKKELIETKENENKLLVQLQEMSINHETQLNQVSNEREELRNYKQEEVASFKEQTRQHARTIVAMEDRLLQLTKQNKQLEMELACHRQPGGKHRPSSPRKESKSPSPRRENHPRPQSPKKEPKQTRSVETETIPQTNVEASLKSDVYKLEQLVLLLRREASQAKKEAQAQADVVQGLRRDLAGASARMSDMAGELSDKQKQKLEENEERIQQQDKELDEQKKQLFQLSRLVDEQQKEIEDREEKLSEHQISFIKHKKDAAKKGTELMEYTGQLVEALEDKEAEIEKIEEENKNLSELHKMGIRCRGERHDQVIARQKEALMDLRKKTKVMEQLKPPLPSHEQSLQQIVVLKNELAELRASIANKEEDYHKTESEMHTELRLLREQSSSNLVETNFEKSSHKQTKESLDLSEKTYLKLSRTLASLLEVDPIPGNRSLAHVPVEEREKIEQEREKALGLLVSRIDRLHERLDRKEKLLGGYEDDLLSLRQTQSLAGQKTAEAKGLKIDVRGRQEEIAYLRESLSRMRDELDQQRRLNKFLREHKKFAMDYEDRDHHTTAHSCHQDEFTRYQDEKKKKKAAEKIRRKNYEIESLKKELLSADRELNSTALKLQALEVSRGLRSDRTLELEDV